MEEGSWNVSYVRPCNFFSKDMCKVELFPRELHLLPLTSYCIRKEGESKAKAREKREERNGMYTCIDGE